MAQARAGEFSRVVRTFPITAGGNNNVNFVDFPATGPTGKLAYLRALRIYCDYSPTGITSGALATTQQNLHNLLSSVTVRTFGAVGFHGPNALNGAQLSALRSLLLASKSTLLRKTGSGDALVGTSTSVARSVLYEIPYYLMGEGLDDFSRSVRSLAAGGGQLNIQFQQLPYPAATQFTAISGTCYVEGVFVESDEFRAVPNIVIQPQAIESLVGGQLGYGTARALMLERIGAAWALGDLTGLEVYLNGQPVVANGNPQVFQAATAPRVNGDSQETFLDPITVTGGFPQFMRIYPTEDYEGRISKLPRGQLTYRVQSGTLTTSQAQWITCMSQPLQVQGIVEQMSAAGMPQDLVMSKLKAGAFEVRGHKGTPTASDDFGEIPLAMTLP